MGDESKNRLPARHAAATIAAARASAPGPLTSNVRHVPMPTTGT
jgi:hypothetical protein